MTAVETALDAAWAPHEEARRPRDGADWPWAILSLEEVLEHERQEAIGTAAVMGFLARVLGERLWAPRQTGLTEGETLRFSWELFKSTVKHGSRFFFTVDDEVALPSNTSDPLRRGGAMLNEFGRLINEFDLVHSVPAAHRVYRVRVHGPGERPVDAAALGTPPARFAGQGRMSAAGIPAFYGADDEETALAETSDRHFAASTVGVFETNRAMRIVDLDSIPRVPSLFDLRPKAQAKRAGLAFLSSFRAELREPIERDDRIHVDYVPTQILAEYLRCIFRDVAGDRVDGVAWTSARRPSGRSLVLFVDNSACLDPSAVADSERLCLRLVEARRQPLG